MISIDNYTGTVNHKITEQTELEGTYKENYWN